MRHLTIFGLLLIGISAFSQVEKGDKEILMFGNFNAPTQGGGGSGTIGVMPSIYLSPHFNLGTSVMTTFYPGPADYLDPEAGNEVKITPFIGVFATYNFLTQGGKVLPYFGIQSDFTWIETVDYIFTGNPNDPLVALVLYEPILYLGGKAGIKFFFTETVNFDINFRYQALLTGPEGLTAGNIGLNFGIGVILPRNN